MALDENTPATPRRAGPAAKVFKCICGATGTAEEHVLGDPVPPHGPKVNCRDCGKHIGWQAKTLLPKRRSDRNSTHRARWIEAQGDLICHICLVARADTRGVFHIDHIKPLEFNGPDEFRNTRPLCNACHVIRHALVTYQRNLRGLPSRNNTA